MCLLSQTMSMVLLCLAAWTIATTALPRQSVVKFNKPQVSNFGTLTEIKRPTFAILKLQENKPEETDPNDASTLTTKHYIRVFLSNFGGYCSYGKIIDDTGKCRQIIEVTTSRMFHDPSAGRRYRGRGRSS